MSERHASSSLRRAACRTRRVVAGGAFAAAAVLVTALPAVADEGLGEKSPSGLSTLDTVLIFVGIPVLVFAVVIALVYGLSRNTEPRLREGQAWWAEPDYYSKDGEQAGSAVTSSGPEAPRTTDGGGTGASW